MQGLAVSAEMQQSSCRLIATLLSLLVFELMKGSGRFAKQRISI